MAISTFQKITQPPQAPSTPVIAQQAIEELIDYYRELAHFHHLSVEYHQELVQQHTKEVEAAQKQLANIEALLHPLEVSDRQNGNGNGSTNGTAKTTVITPSEVKSTPDKQIASKTVEEASESTHQTAIEDSTLHDRKTKDSTTEATKTKKQAKKDTSKTKKSSKSFSSRLPLSEKLAHHETIVDAVAVCLQEYYPRVVSVRNILEYYYPDGLDKLSKKKAYASFSDCLSKGAEKQGWVKISVGNYRWKDESKQS